MKGRIKVLRREKWTEVVGKGRDFPGGQVVETLPASAGDVGLIPGKIPHASGQLNPYATTTEG